MNKIDKYGLNIHIYLSCAIAFLIPTLPILLPIFIGLICINWLFYIIKNGISLKRIGHNNIAIAMIGFYLINLLGLIITDQSNMRYGWFMVEIKLSFTFGFSNFIFIFKTSVRHGFEIIFTW